MCDDQLSYTSSYTSLSIALVSHTKLLEFITGMYDAIHIPVFISTKYMYLRYTYT